MSQKQQNMRCVDVISRSNTTINVSLYVCLDMMKYCNYLADQRTISNGRFRIRETRRSDGADRCITSRVNVCLKIHKSNSYYSID
jgi:hypothetical protein